MLASLFLTRPVRRLERAGTADEVRYAGRLLRIRLATLEYTWRELYNSPRSSDQEFAWRIARLLAQLLDNNVSDTDQMIDELRTETLELARKLGIPVIHLDDDVVAMVTGHIRDYRQWDALSYDGKFVPIRTRADLLACLLSNKKYALRASLPAIWITSRLHRRSHIKAAFLDDGGVWIEASESSRITAKDGEVRITHAAITAHWPENIRHDVPFVEPLVPVATEPYRREVTADITINRRLRVTRFETPPPPERGAQSLHQQDPGESSDTPLQ